MKYMCVREIYRESARFFPNFIELKVCRPIVPRRDSIIKALRKVNANRYSSLSVSDLDCPKKSHNTYPSNSWQSFKTADISHRTANATLNKVILGEADGDVSPPPLPKNNRCHFNDKIVSEFVNWLVLYLVANFSFTVILCSV